MGFWVVLSLIFYSFVNGGYIYQFSVLHSENSSYEIIRGSLVVFGDVASLHLFRAGRIQVIST